MKTITFLVCAVAMTLLAGCTTAVQEQANSSEIELPSGIIYDPEVDDEKYLLSAEESYLDRFRGYTIIPAPTEYQCRKATNVELAQFLKMGDEKVISDPIAVDLGEGWAVVAFKAQMVVSEGEGWTIDRFIVTNGEHFNLIADKAKEDQHAYAIDDNWKGVFPSLKLRFAGRVGAVNAASECYYN